MQKRIIILVVASILLVLASIWAITYRTVRASIYQSLDSRLSTSRVISKSVDNLLHKNIIQLGDISTSLIKNEDIEVVNNIFQNSLFKGNIYIFDINGKIIAAFPDRESEAENLRDTTWFSETMKSTQPIVSTILNISEKEKPRIVISVPLLNVENQKVEGVAIGTIDSSNFAIKELLNYFHLVGRSTVHLVDQNGEIINSSGSTTSYFFKDHNHYISDLIKNREETVGKCHRCHTGQNSLLEKERDVLAFSPLSIAPWGIVITEPEEDVFSSSQTIQTFFLAVGVIYVLFALLLAYGLSKSIVTPVRQLISSAKTIADGNLSEPIRVSRGHEIGLLAESLETMRGKLRESLESFKKYNSELEIAVYERTKKLAKRSEQRKILLQQTLHAQEDERRRIARELHDETNQSILALGMALEVSSNRLKENRLTGEDLYELKKKADDLHDGINRLIHDLRPPVLDDLGFKSAVKWLVEKRFTPLGIKYNLNSSKEFSEDQSTFLDKDRDLRLFRIIQEAVINITKHSGAKNVEISLVYKEPFVEVNIKDDGIGFNLGDVFKNLESGKAKGYGLLGIRERAEHMNGNINIHSKVGNGTEITVTIPISRGDHYEES